MHDTPCSHSSAFATDREDLNSVVLIAALDNNVVLLLGRYVKICLELQQLPCWQVLMNSMRAGCIDGAQHVNDK
jgi:hypothetical protein